MRRILLAEIFLVGLAVAILHKIALSLFLYWTIWWYDIMMHFLGGFLIALIALFVIYDQKFFGFSVRRPVVIFFAAIGVVLIIGMAWELWEIYSGFVNVYEDGLDTIADIGMDFLGAISAYFYSKNKICQLKD